MFCGCKCKSNQIVKVLVKVMIVSEIVKRIDVENSVKTLGAWVSPCLRWKDEFEYAKLKLKDRLKSKWQKT